MSLYKVWKHFRKSFADNDKNTNINFTREESKQNIENYTNIDPNSITAKLQKIRLMMYRKNKALVKICKLKKFLHSLHF